MKTGFIEEKRSKYLLKSSSYSLSFNGLMVSCAEARNLLFGVRCLPREMRGTSLFHRGSLFVVCCLLFVVWCSLFGVWCSLLAP
jgi:hypothetical protein